MKARDAKLLTSGDELLYTHLNGEIEKVTFVKLDKRQPHQPYVAMVASDRFRWYIGAFIRDLKHPTELVRIAKYL